MIAPYDYTNPQPITAGTSKALSGGKLVPFNYATPSPQKPSLTKAVGSAVVQSVGQIGSVFKDDASQILNAFKSSFNQGVSAVDTITNPKGGTPYEGLQAGLGLVEGVGGVFFSPLAPITNQVGALIKGAGEQLANTPYLQGYGKDVVKIPEAQSQNDTASKILQTAAGFGNVAMGILGAKGLEAKPQPLEAPGGGTGTGTYPPLTIRPDTPIPEPVKAPVASKTAPGEVISPKTQVIAPSTVEPLKTGRTTQTLKPIEGTGALKTRTLSQGVEAGAIERNLTSTFGDLPEYRQVNMKDQAEQAAQLINENPDLAHAIALGDKAPPKGLLPESVFVAAEHKATAEGDIQGLRELANSKLAGSATTMGQRIRTLGERDSSSPLAAIQEIQKARAEAQAIRSETAPKVVERIKSSIRKTNTKETWGDFVKSLEC